MMFSAAAASLALAGGCVPSEPNDLDKLGTIDLAIKGRTFQLWVADQNEERLRGLMFVNAEQMADLPDGKGRGMIFAFEFDQEMSFWMRNTIIPLDIAYLDSNGVVLNTHTMAPLDERFNQYPSAGPARYAIEVNANVWTAIGLQAGDRLAIPSPLLKKAP